MRTPSAQERRERVVKVAVERLPNFAFRDLRQSVPPAVRAGTDPLYLAGGLRSRIDLHYPLVSRHLRILTRTPAQKSIPAARQS
jgi:hypothetical protein